MNNVAQTIANQIGNKAFFMLGAKDLTAQDFGLTFKVGKNAEGVNFIKVTLRADDTYNVEAFHWNARKMVATPKGHFQAVYVDSLHRTIESLTGMYTSL